MIVVGSGHGADVWRGRAERRPARDGSRGVRDRVPHDRAGQATAGADPGQQHAAGEGRGDATRNGGRRGTAVGVPSGPVGRDRVEGRDDVPQPEPEVRAQRRAPRRACAAPRAPGARRGRRPPRPARCPAGCARACASPAAAASAGPLRDRRPSSGQPREDGCAACAAASRNSDPSGAPRSSPIPAPRRTETGRPRSGSAAMSLRGRPAARAGEHQRSGRRQVHRHVAPREPGHEVRDVVVEHERGCDPVGGVHATRHPARQSERAARRAGGPPSSQLPAQPVVVKQGAVNSYASAVGPTVRSCTFVMPVGASGSGCAMTDARTVPSGRGVVAGALGQDALVVDALQRGGRGQQPCAGEVAGRDRGLQRCVHRVAPRPPRGVALVGVDVAQRVAHGLVAGRVEGELAPVARRPAAAPAPRARPGCPAGRGSRPGRRRSSCR